MEYLGLLFEFLFLGIGIYLYLFSRGFFKVKDPALQEKAEEFRKKNGTILRLLGLALAAIMLMNIILHLSALVKS